MNNNDRWSLEYNEAKQELRIGIASNSHHRTYYYVPPDVAATVAASGNVEKSWLTLVEGHYRYSETNYCIHCGLEHGLSLASIAEECRAVKKVTSQGYVYENGQTKSYPGITSIEYVSIEEQERLIKAALLSGAK